MIKNETTEAKKIEAGRGAVDDRCGLKDESPGMAASNSKRTIIIKADMHLFSTTDYLLLPTA